MFIEILIILLIIIVLFVFLIFFKTWHIHINFKNHNLDHDLSVDINFLCIQITLNKVTSDTAIDINLNLFSIKKHLTSLNLNSTKKPKEEEKNSIDKKDEQEKDLFNKIKKIVPLLLESKEDIYEIIILIIQVIRFKKSNIQANIGLADNNLTIKLCNLLWALSAPLYPLHFELILTPQINEAIIKSNGNISFDMKLINFLKIILIILRNSKLRTVVNIIID